MLALGLTLAIFVFWTVTGLAVLRTLRTTENVYQEILLAPVTGFAVVLLTVFLVSRGGAPMGVAALPIGLGWLVAASAAIWRNSYPISLGWSTVWVATLLVALLLVGRPMLEFGFDWVSYSNDDMANYTLAAARIVNYGFFEIPRAGDLLAGQDYSLTYWFFNLGVRPGAEMLVAWTSGLTRLTPHQVFMPLILATNLVLVSSAGAAICQSAARRSAALATCGLLAVSALTALGTLYQLIGQVGGLSLLVGTATVLFRPFGGMSRATLSRHGVSIAVLGAALFVMYPEVVPFLGLAWLLYLAVTMLRQREKARAILVPLGIAVVAGLVLLNSYALISLAFLRSQATSGMAGADLETLLFPYFLLPSGLATVWGLQSIVRLTGDPWLSISIAVGSVLLILVAVAALRESSRCQPVALFTIVMLGLAVRLFVQRADFGLFKLAMFIQPFMLATLVLAWFGIVRKPVQRFAPVVALGVAGLYAQTAYVERSRGVLDSVGGGLSEIPNASPSRINSEFRQLLSGLQSDYVVLDTSNVVLAKFQALYLRGRASTFPTQDFFENIANADPGFQLLNPNIPLAANELRAARNQRFSGSTFDLHDPDLPEAGNPFIANMTGQPPSVDASSITLIATTPEQSLLNRWDSTQIGGVDFESIPWVRAVNRLVFISSARGQPYYSADRRRVSLYQLEADLFFPSRTMAGLGRYFLFQIINPTPQVRLVLDMTATLKGDGVNMLPPAAVIGTTREPLPLEGRGAARVFSAPVTPQIIDGRAYVMIDMGDDGKTFPMSRPGLMNWFGTDVLFDRRRLVGFGRAISAISEDQFAALRPPSKLQGFPASLEDPQLAYSGVYEDGWASERVTAELYQPAAASMLRMRGTMPVMPSRSPLIVTARVRVDGQEVGQQELQPGTFDLQFPVDRAPGRHRVQAEFSAVEPLPAPDNRLVSAYLDSFGYEDPSESGAASVDVVTPGEGLALGSGWYPVEDAAREPFRWVNNDAGVIVNQRDAAQRTLRIDFEPGPSLGLSGGTLTLVDDQGHVVATRALKGPRQVWAVSVPFTSRSVAAFRLKVEGGSGLSVPNDARVLNLRVFRIS